MPEIKRLDRLPVQTMPLCGGVDGGGGAHACHALRKPLRYASDPVVFAEQLNADDALALLACERIDETQRMMKSEQVRGVLKLYLQTAGQLQPVSSEVLYQGADAVLEAIAVMRQMPA